MTEIDVAFHPPKKKREAAELDITPMIDITFLLLAFFVMVSKMDPQVPIALPTATYGDSVQEKNCVVLSAFVSENDPKLADIFQGKTKDPSKLVTGETPMDKEAVIGGYVEDQISLRPTIQAVLIKAEGNVKTGVIELIKRGISGSELAQTRQIFIAVEDQ